MSLTEGVTGAFAVSWMYVCLRVKGVWKPSCIALSILQSAPSHSLTRLCISSHRSFTSIVNVLSGQSKFCNQFQANIFTGTSGGHRCAISTSHTISQNMERNGEIRSKRKTSPIATMERPAKQLRPEISSMDGADELSSDSHPYSPESDGEPRLVLPTAATADTAEWQATIENVVKNVVSIHFCQTCSFDTDSACSSEATGFVVDAERGYILTNRHVVCAGPFWGYCIFDNHEEVDGALSIPYLHMGY